MSERPTIKGSVSKRGHRHLAQLPPSMGRGGALFDTEDEAWQWLRTENAKRTLGIVRAPDQGAPTVGEMIDVWLLSSTIKESTRIDYRIRIDRHIRGHHISQLPVDAVRGMHVDRCLSETPANWTRVHVAKILGPFFLWLQQNQYTVGNAYQMSQARRLCQLVYRAHERKESTDRAWTTDELGAFLRHESSPVYRDYWVFVAATGARRGEAIGLTWDNVHAADGWAWLADNITTSGSEIIHSETPKTWKRRKAYFGEVVGKMLLARKDDQDRYRASVDGWRSSGWVFDRRQGKGKRFYPGVHLAPATVTARFNRHAAELGLPPLSGPHGLRRTLATVAEEAGLKGSVRTALLGHTPDIGGVYTKPSELDMRNAVDLLASIILPNGLPDA